MSNKAFSCKNFLGLTISQSSKQEVLLKNQCLYYWFENNLIPLIDFGGTEVGLYFLPDNCVVEYLFILAPSLKGF